ncbi:PIF1-like helicase-domain-containing protein [Scheffersomyces xylosifermentans]|uniref:PIF1-like helicase-domain-containing protein n=1 Tax=Scheffersomyces xylosifermentans TaxID=1304137 RepID=UPI00315D03D4
MNRGISSIYPYLSKRWIALNHPSLASSLSTRTFATSVLTSASKSSLSSSASSPRDRDSRKSKSTRQTRKQGSKGKKTKEPINMSQSSVAKQFVYSHRQDRLERDPSVIQSIEDVDFNSSFDSDLSQERNQSSNSSNRPKIAPSITKADTKRNGVTKKENDCVNFKNDESEIAATVFADKIDSKAVSSPNDSGIESDTFLFSDDDEEILQAAAKHALSPIQKPQMKQEALFVASSPHSSPAKRQASSPIKEIKSQSKRHLSQVESKSQNHHEETRPQKGTVDANKSSEVLIGIPPIIEKVSTNTFKTPTSTSAASILNSFSNKVPQQQNLNMARNFSKSASSSSKSASFYPSIQLATQKPTVVDFSEESGEFTKNVKPILLSAEQEYVLNQALNGESLFYTGSAGTGKSVLLRSMIKALRNKHKEGIAVTASTGLAACNIGGITLHSFAGVGLANDKVDNLLKKLRRNKKALNRWMTTKVLIVDEISMIDGHLLDKLNEIAKRVRKNYFPFGGIQVIVCGDFYQLPPVVKKTAPDGTELSTPVEPFFSFECYAWKETIKETIILREIFRQKGDQTFIDMLNEMRNGRVSERTIQEFQRLSRPLPCPDGIVPAELFATRNEVDRANNTRLGKIPGTPELYKSIDGGALPAVQRQNLLSNFLAPMELFLKKGAQVMCIKNYDETLVNGSLGQVVDFMDRDTYLKSTAPATETDAGESSDYIFDRSDDELRLPSSEAQGQVVSTSSLNSQIYSQLSADEKMNRDRKESLAKDLIESSKNRKYPLVRFLLPDGVNTRSVLVEPEQWTVEDENQQVLVSRVQLPLILAWSLSIHKSQGQTLPKVKVDLRNVFENGQSYVALSRAVSRSGLQVLNFNETKVRTHPKVIQFYRTLLTASDVAGKKKGQQSLNFQLISPAAPM